MATNTGNATANRNNYDDTGFFNDNNISQNVLCTSSFMNITPYSYILCIPRIPYTTTKIDVARAVENQILSSGKRRSDDIENFEYVKHVTFIRAFDEVVYNELRTASLCGVDAVCRDDPWYKLAFVTVEIPPGYSENGVQYYTNGEDAFYSGVCRGDIIINSWTDAFFVAHPRNYFQPAQQMQSTEQIKPAQKQTKTNSEVCETQYAADAAFQKWKYEFKLRQLERKVKEHENTIRQNELDVIQAQNMANEYAESIRFLTRGYSSDLQGLQSKSIPMTTFLSELNNRYARVCASDTTFLEVNRNMKLKEMNGYSINACDDCDACQELIHSIDDTRAEYRDELFDNIEKTICRINRSVQQFEKLHLHAERSLFGLRNRRVLEDFGMYLNTALEIVEEVTSRVAAFTQDLEYARCYGGLFQKQHQNEISYSQSCGYGYNYDYDYSEDADEVYENEDHDGDIESTQKMLDYFDEHSRELYKEQQEQQETQQQEQQPTSPIISKINTTAGVYHEEAVIIEGEENVVKCDATADSSKSVVETATTCETVSQEIQQKKRGWLSSWF